MMIDGIIAFFRSQQSSTNKPDVKNLGIVRPKFMGDSCLVLSYIGLQKAPARLLPAPI